jgi:hypothetical protein
MFCQDSTRSGIFVYLRDEGTDVWRPVDAVLVGPSQYRIVGENRAPDDEHWEFSAGESFVARYDGC